jgi:acyl-CoA thioester hydrolase
MSDHHDHTLRVRYAETDQMGWVYHSHYLTWFEVGRTEFIRSRGLPYREIEGRGYLLPLVEAGLRLRLASRYDDVLVVRTRIDSIESRRVVFAYEIRRDEEPLASGNSSHVCTDVSTGKAVVIPRWIRELLSGDRPSD